MAWQHYSLKFRLQSPLTVGKRKVGNLMETRHYVPGKTLWGALTARITRNEGFGRQGQKYKEIGRKVQTHMRFGYLWVSTKPLEPIYPWDDPTRFEYEFLGSYTSTALNYGQFSAENGSLHEIEFISPYSRSGAQVYLVGSLWIQDGWDEYNWQLALSQLQLGGERGYGWGRVDLVGINAQSHASIGNPDHFSNFRTRKIPAHLYVIDPRTASLCKGELEPLVGWETSPDGVSRTTPVPRVAYLPGVKIKAGENSSSLVFRIGHNGVWEVQLDGSKTA